MPRRTGLILVALTCVVAALGASGAQARSRGAAQRAGRHDVIANLFEWNWRSVRRECRRVLGPAGYGGVQVAPPQDSLSRSGPAPVHPWWEVYQPVGYRLTSRMGNERQFRRMVAGCRAAGVKVYVDAVINHMTGQGDTSYGGVHYTKYDYPASTPAPTSTTIPATAPAPTETSTTSTTTCRSPSASWSASAICARRPRRCAGRSPATSTS
jgi:alpha-amylase